MRGWVQLVSLRAGRIVLIDLLLMMINTVDDYLQYDRYKIWLR